jgi:diguanylate cyclase (GGDEF)-like protein
MIDLDDFKMVNDRFGHLAGDSVIKEVAVILRRTVRMFDVCTRYGGEEFAILMPNSGAQSAATVAERIRRRIESYRFTEPSLVSLSATARIGLAVSTAQLLPRDLIERADQALYQAKTLGKNRVWFDDPGAVEFAAIQGGDADGHPLADGRTSGRGGHGAAELSSDHHIFRADAAGRPRVRR